MSILQTGSVVNSVLIWVYPHSSLGFVSIFSSDAPVRPAVSRHGLCPNLVQPHCFQEKLYREVKENSNASNEDFALEWQDFGNYKYTEMVVKETLRLFPIGPMVLRHITQDLHLKNHVVPAGSSLMITMFRTHRLPEIWPEPDKFIPERFLPELNASRHPYAYVPFSAGPRSCIGKFMIASFSTCCFI